MAGKRPYYYFNPYVNREWKAKCKWEVFSKDNGFYLVKFEMLEDLEKVLNGGTWFMDSKLIFTNIWDANFQFDRDMLDSYSI